MQDDVLDEITALLERVRREAYQQGYDEAVRRILAAASTSGAPAQHGPVVAQAARSTAADRGGDGDRKRLPKGAADKVVVSVLEANPQGLSVAEIEQWSETSETPVTQPVIRLALKRLLDGGQVRQEGRRWLPSEQSPTSPADQDETREESAVHEDADAAEPQMPDELASDMAETHEERDAGESQPPSELFHDHQH